MPELLVQGVANGLVTGAVFAVIAVVSQRHLELSKLQSFSAGQTFLLMCHNLIFYPWNMIWPAHLSSFYPFPENISLFNGIGYGHEPSSIRHNHAFCELRSIKTMRRIISGCTLSRISMR